MPNLGHWNARFDFEFGSILFIGFHFSYVSRMIDGKLLPFEVPNQPDQAIEGNDCKNDAKTKKHPCFDWIRQQQE